jgi:hypothetical protein
LFALSMYLSTSAGPALVEAGVTVVSVASRFPVRIPEANDPGGWDTHGHNFKLLRAKLPIYDQAVYALLTDLHQTRLDRDVAVVIWGEFGRTPRIGDSTPDGRGHWHESGSALLAGGGLRTGQVVGESDARGEGGAAHLIARIDQGKRIALPDRPSTVGIESPGQDNGWRLPA